MPETFLVNSPEANKRLEDVDRVVQRLLSFRRPYEARWAEMYRHFVGKAETRTYPDGSPRANIFFPYPYANVRHVRATLTEALFGMDPPFEVLPRGMKDDEAAIKMQLVLEYLVLRRGRLRSVFDEFIGSLAVYGFAALDVGWDWDYDLVYDWDDQIARPDASTPPQLIGNDPRTGEPLVINPATGQPLLQRVRILRPVPRNQPKYTVLDIFDIAVDPDGAYIAKFFDKTLPQMQRENQTAQEAGFTLYNPDSLQRLAEQMRNAGASEADRNAIVRICELWNAVDGDFSLYACGEDLTTLGFKDERYAFRSASYAHFRRSVAQVPKMLLATGYNPFAHCHVPILYSHYTKLPGETFGMGVIEPNYGLNEALNKTASMIEDNWNMGVNQRFAYDATRDIDLGDLQEANVPGGLVGVYGDPERVLMPLQAHAPTGEAYAILPMFQRMIEVTASISDPYQRGVGSPTGNRTASGIQSVIQQSSKPMTQLAMQVSEDVLEPLLSMTASNVQQFVKDELEVRLSDEPPVIPKVQSQFLTIKPSDLAGGFDFRIVGAAYMENRFMTQRNAQSLFALTMQHPAFAAYAKPYEGLRELYRIHRLPNPNRFVKTPEEVAIEQQQMMMQQMQQAMMMQQLGLQPPPQGGNTPARGAPLIPNAPVTGAVRGMAQQMGANATGMAGMGEATP